jgi:hypothetical protein
VDGRTYLMEPLTLGRLGVCEQYCLSLRRTPFDKVAPLLVACDGNADVQEQLWMAAYNELDGDRGQRLVTYEDLLKWLDTAAGVAFTAWLCLQNNPRPPFLWLEMAESYYARAFQDRPGEIDFFRRVRNQISGLDLFASLDFPPAEESAVRPKYMPWRKIIHAYAAQWHWPFEWVARMTLYHVKLYPADENALGGVGMVEPGQHEVMAKLRQEQRAAARDKARDSFRRTYLRRGNPDVP